eukprot:scaffold2394_cov276-Pinguiococcus_pyrenoidosus.AAC.10
MRSRPQQWSGPILSRSVQRCTAVDQQQRSLVSTRPASHVKRGLSAVAHRVDMGAAVQQAGDDLSAVRFRRSVQRRRSIEVLRVHWGSTCQQETRDGLASPKRRRVQRRDATRIHALDVRSCRDEKVRKLDPVVCGSKVQWAPSVLVRNVNILCGLQSFPKHLKVPNAARQMQVAHGLSHPRSVSPKEASHLGLSAVDCRAQGRSAVLGRDFSIGLVPQQRRNDGDVPVVGGQKHWRPVLPVDAVRIGVHLQQLLGNLFVSILAGDR